MEEIWKDIKGYEESYQISNYGKIKIKGNSRTKKSKEKKCWYDKNGYLMTNLSKNNKKKQYFIHRLVAINFLDKNNFKCLPKENKNEINIKDLTVNHKDGNKTNNYVDNLEWCTNRYNVNHFYKNNTLKRKRKNVKYKSKINEAIKYIKNNDSLNEETKKELINILK